MRQNRAKNCRFLAQRPAARVWYGRAALAGTKSSAVLVLLVALGGFLLILGAARDRPGAERRASSGLQQKQAALSRRVAGGRRRALRRSGAVSTGPARDLAPPRRAGRTRSPASRSRPPASTAPRSGRRSAAQRRLGGQLRLPLRAGRARPDRRHPRGGLARRGDRRPRRRQADRPRDRRSVLEQATRREAAWPRSPAAADAVQVARTNAERARPRRDGEPPSSSRHASERSAYLARLRQEQQLTAAQIATAPGARRSAQRASVGPGGAPARRPPQPDDSDLGRDRHDGRTQTTTTPDRRPGRAAARRPSTPSPTSSDGRRPPPPRPPPKPGGTMSVYATGYCLSGTTATGLPVGPGIVAIDPSVIPLGHADDDPGLRRRGRRRHGGRDPGRPHRRLVRLLRRRRGLHAHGHDHLPLNARSATTTSRTGAVHERRAASGLTS